MTEQHETIHTQDDDIDSEPILTGNDDDDDEEEEEDSDAEASDESDDL